MNNTILMELWASNDEERRTFKRLPLDTSIYFSDKALIKSEKMLGSAKYEVGIKTHPRYVAFPEHGHNFVEMMLVLSGCVTHKIGEKELKLIEGDVLLMNKHVRHSIDSAGTEDLGVNVIMTDSFFNSLSPELPEAVFSGFLRDNASSNGKGAFLHFSAKKSQQAENLIENIILELTEPQRNSAVLSRTLALLFCCLGAKPELLTEASDPADAEEDRRARIITYIKNNYRTASLSELGQRLFLSVPYLSGLISSYFGKSFKELLLEERLCRADILIKETDMPISEVVRSVGYENASYFHREYKKRFGATPLARRSLCKL